MHDRIAPRVTCSISSMKKLTFLAAVCLASFLQAQHPVLCSDYNGGHVTVLSADGKIEWQVEAKSPQDCWRLPNGNILFAYVGGVKEMTKDKEVVWEYKAPEKADPNLPAPAPGQKGPENKVEVHGCQPLPNGDVMILECGTSRIIEVNRAVKIVKEIKLVTKPEVKTHNQFRGTRKTAEGHYIVSFKGEGMIKELDGDGKVLREISVPGDPHGALLLPNKNLLATCGDAHKVQEIDPSGKVVWELNENDIPGNPLRLMAGCQRLPNGNTIFCNYLGHGHIGEQPVFFEITPDKKLVWEFKDNANFKTINQLMTLDIPGDVTKGEILK